MPLGDSVKYIRDLLPSNARNPIKTILSLTLLLTNIIHANQNEYSVQVQKMTVSRDAMLLSNPILLEKIDKLRDLNISQHVPLPQVKSGDQQPI